MLSFANWEKEPRQLANEHSQNELRLDREISCEIPFRPEPK